MANSVKISSTIVSKIYHIPSLDMSFVLNECNILKNVKGCKHIVDLKDIYTGNAHIDIKLTKHTPFVDKLEKLSNYSIKRIIQQLFIALEYLHDIVGVRHGDIKLTNFLLDKNDNLLVCDFSHSKFLRFRENVPYRYTESCTPGYIPVEHEEISLLGNDTASYSTPDPTKIDIYCAGIAIIAMYKKVEQGFEMTCYDTVDELQRLMNKTPVVPRIVQPLVLKLMDIDPSKRPTAREVLKHKMFTPQKTNCFSGMFIPKFDIDLNISLSASKMKTKKNWIKTMIYIAATINNLELSDNTYIYTLELLKKILYIKRDIQFKDINYYAYACLYIISCIVDYDPIYWRMLITSLQIPIIKFMEYVGSVSCAIDYRFIDLVEERTMIDYSLRCLRILGMSRKQTRDYLLEEGFNMKDINMIIGASLK